MIRNRRVIFAAVVVAVVGMTLVGCRNENNDKKKMALALLGLSNCASFLGQPSSEYVWPAAPDTARIAYVGTLSDNKYCLRANNEATKALEYPKAAAIDANGKVYVADRRAVYVFDTNVGSMKPFAAGSNAPIEARGIATTDDGRVFITDNNRKKVMVYDQSGNLTAQIGGAELTSPQGMAVDKRLGRLYVADALSKTVVGYDLNGNIVVKLTGDLALPTQAAVNSKGMVYVVNQGVKKVQVFNSDGTQMFGWGNFNASPGNFIRPKGIAIDSEDHVYVTDSAFDNFQIFRDDGQLLMWVGEAGPKPGQFSLPGLIFVDSKDRIFVSDFGAHRVQVFQYLGAK